MVGFGVLVWFLIWWCCLFVSVCLFVLVGWVFWWVFLFGFVVVFALFCFLGKRWSVIFNSVFKYLNSVIFKEIPSY